MASGVHRPGRRPVHSSPAAKMRGRPKRFVLPFSDVLSLASEHINTDVYLVPDDAPATSLCSFFNGLGIETQIVDNGRALAFTVSNSTAASNVSFAAACLYVTRVYQAAATYWAVKALEAATPRAREAQQ